MPAQLSTILYVQDCKEKLSSDFLIINATGYTRIEEDGDRTQKFNITAFYPLDDDKPRYLPKKKLQNEQVLSISNAKFNKSNKSGELDVS
jgi:hypothetical protein